MAQTTKKRIMEGFLQLLEQRPLDKISVVDVADHCGINRNTFYYYYCDIYALIRELMELVAQRMIAEGLSDRNWGIDPPLLFPFAAAVGKALSVKPPAGQRLSQRVRQQRQRQ